MDEPRMSGRERIARERERVRAEERRRHEFFIGLTAIACLVIAAAVVVILVLGAR
jgi:hypothetical protein